MPNGLLNYALATTILGLKFALLPRCWFMPGFALYLGTSVITSVAYLFGWESASESWSAPVAILGVLAALEAIDWAVPAHDEERLQLSRWCLLLGGVFCFAGALGSPEPYPHYPVAVYFLRLYSALGATGALVGLLGYCFANKCGGPPLVAHSVILAARLATMGAMLLAHDRATWWTADLAGGLVNVLTLAGWLWIFRRRAAAV